MKLLYKTMPGILASSWTDLLLFKASWIMLVIYQSAAIVPALFIIFVKLFSWQDLGHSLALVLTTVLAGVTMDLTLAGAGVFVFAEPFFPPWLVILWLSFALTLPRGFGFVLKLHPSLQALTGLMTGGFGYFAGHLLGAVEFGIGSVPALLLIALLWAIFVPTLIWLDAKFYNPIKVDADA